MIRQKIPKSKKKAQASLSKMFRLQKEFQARFYDFNKMQPFELVEYQRLMLTCIIVESTEALDWLNWKPWKKTKEPFDRYEFINELVDIQHFLINVVLSTNCSSVEFGQLFANKHLENINRQKRGY